VQVFMHLLFLGLHLLFLGQSATHLDTAHRCVSGRHASGTDASHALAALHVHVQDADKAMAA
jgi:hypothetical protein